VIAQGIGGLAPSFIFDGKGGMYITDWVFGQVLKFDLTSAVHESLLAATAIDVFPNPSSQQVNISYELKQAANVSLEIFDLRGKRVAGFEAGEKPAGTHTETWDGYTNRGRNVVSAGTYVYRLTVGNELVSGLIQMVR
jgi:flagellar hook assembly protein FlgD